MTNDNLSSVVDIASARSPLSYARRYARLGWHVVPLWWPVKGEDGVLRCACGGNCSTPAKHPISVVAIHGMHSSSTDEGQIERWWTRYPEANIGIVMVPSNLVGIDIDPRNGGNETIEDLESRYGRLRSDLLQFTGGGGEHRVFQLPAGAANSLPGVLGNGVDVKALGYLVVEPSLHMSGKRYAWEASSDPLDGILPSVLPDWVRSIRPQRAQVTEQGSRTLEAAEVLELQSALATLDADSRDTWLSAGMALHSTDAGMQAFGLWTDWSRQSSKYDSADQSKTWRSFRTKGLAGLTVAWIFGQAQATGWLNPRSAAAQQFASVPVESVRIAAPAPSASQYGAPGPLPGVGRAIVDWIDATSHRPQPQFSVQAALAFASVVLGRRVTTNRRNWPSLYFLNVGKSASGKEHAKWAVEQLLEACGCEQLIGPSGYTSDSGVLSALVRQPVHLTVVDEFGKVLEAAAIKQNARAQSSMRALMEAWGRVDGVMRPQGFSTFGLSSKEADELAGKTVRNPALTLMAMTTPEAFFNAIGTAAARDGFLNRFLIVESDIGRQVGNDSARVAVPQSVIDWAAAQTVIAGPVNPSLSSSMSPTPRVLAFNTDAAALLRDFERDCIDSMDALDDSGLAEMWGRSCEMAMRLSLIVACLEQANEIGAAAVQWSIQYVRHHAERAVHSLRTKVADSDFQRASKQVLAAITKAGARGVTVRDLCKVSRLFDAAKPRDRDDMLAGLVQAGSVQLVEIEGESGRGKKRVAWVPVAMDDE